MKSVVLVVEAEQFVGQDVPGFDRAWFGTAESGAERWQLERVIPGGNVPAGHHGDYVLTFPTGERVIVSEASVEAAKQ